VKVGSPTLAAKMLGEWSILDTFAGDGVDNFLPVGVFVVTVEEVVENLLLGDGRHSSTTTGSRELTLWGWEIESIRAYPTSDYRFYQN